jgi:hypothetical protein
MAFPGGAFPELERYYQDCVVGGEGAFVMVAHDSDELALTIRRKLILEISGVMPHPTVLPAQFLAPMDCLIGEKLYRQRGWNR